MTRPSIGLAPSALWGRPVVIGGGIAGGVAALTLAPRPTVLLDPAPMGRAAASSWAQGGIAAAVGPDDSVALHGQDTVAAGAGLSDPDMAARITAAGPRAVAALEEFGVRFDRAASGEFALGLEAAHARRRILHVKDATGNAVLEALAARILKTPAIECVSAAAIRLIVEDGAIAGVLFRQGGETLLLPSRAVVLATGGVGGLWRSTTNPVTARGGGLALAARAGAVLADLEFVQFHPTALAVGADPMPLISEAVRGEGAILIDADGKPFMEGVSGGDLAPRDVLARAVFRQWAGGGRAALDVRRWPAGKFANRFPNIHRVLADYGLDPSRDPIPVRPAAHYHMGGIKTGLSGKTTIEGLWACGEVACTGFHGANRLASNSLLEAVVCGRWVAEDVAGTPPTELRVPRGIDFEALSPADGDILVAMRNLMDAEVGVVRDEAGLTGAIGRLVQLCRIAAGTEASDTVATALLIAVAAERRRENRGAHWRIDAGPPDDPPAHSVSRLSDLDALDI